MVPLDLLCPGEIGRVVDIDGNQDLVHRLAEMGVCHGAELQMVRPGRPCIIALDNRRISFRGDKAAAILVETVGRPASTHNASAHNASTCTSAATGPASPGAGVSASPGAGAVASARRSGLGRWLGAW